MLGLVDCVWELHSKGKLLQADDRRLLNESSLNKFHWLFYWGFFSNPHPKACHSMRQIV